jgi:hypothetical protein
MGVVLVLERGHRLPNGLSKYPSVVEKRGTLGRSVRVLTLPPGSDACLGYRGQVNFKTPDMKHWGIIPRSLWPVSHGHPMSPNTTAVLEIRNVHGTLQQRNLFACPKCLGTKTKHVDSMDNGMGMWHWRMACTCGHRWTVYNVD